MVYFLRTSLAVFVAFLMIAGPARANDWQSQFAHTVDYIAAHGVSVVPSSDGGNMVVLETDFTPASRGQLRLMLGDAVAPATAADLGPVARIKGLQVFRVPAGVDVSAYTAVHLWNPERGVVVGTIPLK